MKTTSYKTYKCNGFTLNYYSKSLIQDGVYYGEYVVAYYNRRRIAERSTSEKRGLYDIICRLSDEERRRTTEAYIRENAARMGVAPITVEAHIEEVQKKNCRAAVPAPKLELTAADIALYDYALGGAPVDGYTIGCADAVLKLMKKEGITPAAVDRARKKMKKQQPAAAPAPVVDTPAAPVVDAPAADEQPAVFTPHIESNGDLHYENYTVKDDNGNAVVFGSYIPAALLMDAPAADDAPAAPVVDTADDAPAAPVVDTAADDAPAAPAADEQPAAPSIKNADTPSNQKKQFAAWGGAVVEILGICAADNTAVVKIKGGSRTSVPADALEPTTAKKTTLPDWMMPGAVIDVKNAVRNDAPSTRHTIESVKATNIYYTDGTYSSINYIMHYGSPVDDAPAAPVVDVPAADAAPTADTPALTDADVLAAAARIKSNYEKMRADINRDEKTSIANKILDEINYMPENCNPDTMMEYLNMYLNGIITANEFKNATLEAMKQQAAADAYADAITAYCAALEEPAAPAWAPEIITVTPCPAWDDTPAVDAAPAPRHRRRLNIAPRLSRWLHPARWVAAAFVVCLLSGLLLGMNTSTAADTDAAADDIAAVYDLHPVTVTASSLTTAPAAPSPVKKLAAPSPVKKAAADAVTLSNQKTAPDIATATAPAADDADTLTTAPAANGLQPTPPDGLTICAGTAWAYTMMQWA